jgi:hypothetical protein
LSNADSDNSSAVPVTSPLSSPRFNHRSYSLPVQQIAFDYVTPKSVRPYDVTVPTSAANGLRYDGILSPWQRVKSAFMSLALQQVVNVKRL